MDASENDDPDQQVNAPHNGMEEEELHRSDRQRNPTEKMRAYKKEEALKKEKGLIHLYEQWKDRARNTRAELKTDSDTVFGDRDLSNELQADSCPVRLKLTTMTAKDVVMPSEKVSGLKVRGYSSPVVLNLPPAYTKDSIP
ncbi:hypothetical protein DPEC_G00373480, partial [Dallia pectoralis]